MALSREVSLGTGLATAGLVWGIFNSALPSVAEARVAAPIDRDLAATERAATWTAAAVVSGISLIAKDATVFVLGGSMVVALAWWHRHANHFDPQVASAVTPSMNDTGNAVTNKAVAYTPGN